jgi:hypothetical protein
LLTSSDRKMRLLHASTYEVREFYRDTPHYAILSHTWSKESKDEISYQDIGNLDQARQKVQAFSKIEWCAHYAISNSLQWIWVDTCCIDKTSSAELSEAITSMYRWYKEADACFVHLEGVGPGQKNLASARWFTRGWTLQELLAPRRMEFFNSSWDHIGTRDQLKVPIARATGIPGDVISKQRNLSLISVQVKWSWAKNRQTTRPEDLAYCLCGIFDVSMQAIYGEGEVRAFGRLREEINKPRHTVQGLFNATGSSNTTGNPTPSRQGNANARGNSNMRGNANAGGYSNMQGNANAGGYSNMRGNTNVRNPINPNVTGPGRPNVARPAKSMKAKTSAYTADSSSEDDSSSDEGTAFPNILPTHRNVHGAPKTTPGGGYQTEGYQIEGYQIEGFQPGGFQPGQPGQPGGFQPGQPGGFQPGEIFTPQFPGYLNLPEPERKRSPLQRLGMGTGANSKGNESNKKKNKQKKAPGYVAEYEEYEYE